MMHGIAKHITSLVVAVMMAVAALAGATNVATADKTPEEFLAAAEARMQDNEVVRAMAGFLTAARLGHPRGQRRVIEFMFSGGNYIKPGPFSHSQFLTYVAKPREETYARQANTLYIWKGRRVRPLERFFRIFWLILLAEEGNSEARTTLEQLNYDERSDEGTVIGALIALWREGTILEWSIPILIGEPSPDKIAADIFVVLESLPPQRAELLTALELEDRARSFSSRAELETWFGEMFDAALKAGQSTAPPASR